MPGTRKQPLHTRKGRAQALLRLSRPVLDRLTETPPLRDSLPPFRAKSADPFSATAFIHSFGCRGPSEADWHALFKSAGALRPEDLSVVIAYTACAEHVEEVVLGSPGILDHVCRLWDEWLVDKAMRVTAESVESEAARWGVAKSADGLVWGTDGRGDGESSQYLLGQSIDIVGMRIVEDVMRRAVEHSLERASLGGQQRFMELLAGRGNAAVDAALARAKSVLVNRVFQITGERNCSTA